jgi:hypothetical protein
MVRGASYGIGVLAFLRLARFVEGIATSHVRDFRSSISYYGSHTMLKSTLLIHHSYIQSFLKECDAMILFSICVTTYTPFTKRYSPRS